MSRHPWTYTCTERISQADISVPAYKRHVKVYACRHLNRVNSPTTRGFPVVNTVQFSERVISMAKMCVEKRDRIAAILNRECDIGGSRLFRKQKPNKEITEG